MRSPASTFGGSPITSSVARPETGCHVAPLRSETRSTANRVPSLRRHHSHRIGRSRRQRPGRFDRHGLDADRLGLAAAHSSPGRRRRTDSSSNGATRPPLPPRPRATGYCRGSTRHAPRDVEDGDPEHSAPAAATSTMPQAATARTDRPGCPPLRPTRRSPAADSEARAAAKESQVFGNRHERHSGRKSHGRQADSP